MAPKRTTRSTADQETINATSVTNAQLHAMIDQGVTAALAARDALKSTNGDDTHNSGTGNTHVKTVGHDAAYAMPWKTLMKMMTDKYCPRNEIKKLEMELWDLKEAACHHYEEHMMDDCVQLDHVVDSHDEYTSDSNIKGGVKFLMFPRFLQVFLDKQVKGMAKHKEIYVISSHAKKIFANMRRQGVTPPNLGGSGILNIRGRYFIDQ
nr:reverse transcriptase domain-containing protein [Tanacetum cinerariifolium]